MKEKNVFFLLTRFQLDLYFKIKNNKLLRDIYIIIPCHLEKYLDENDDVSKRYVYDLKDKKIGFARASEIKEVVKDIIRKLELNVNDNFWIANDENLLIQCLYNMIRFYNVYFLEDGLGSYVKSGFFAYNEGFIQILKRFSYFIFLFPYYKAFYRVGGNIQARVGYSYYDKAFPMQKNINRVVIKKKYKKYISHSLAKNNDVIFVGQPLVECRYMTQGQYIKSVKYVQEKIGGGGSFIYKPHPLEKNIDILIDSGINVDQSHGIPIEDFVFSSGENLKVYSFNSTALMNIKDFKNVSEIVSLRLKGSNLPKNDYEFIRVIGVSILDI